MKKRTVTLIALTLALSMLAGCAMPWTDLSGWMDDKLSQITNSAQERNPDGVMFSDIRYARPDLDKLGADVAAAETALESGASLEEVEELLDVCMDGYDDFITMYHIANIYNNKDLRDEYYAAEFEWISTAEADVSDLFDELYYACAGSSLGKALEEDYFWEGFCEDYADPDDSYYTDETVALMQRESELISRYRELVADPTVVYRGEERSVNELLDELSGLAFYSVVMMYYGKYNEPLAEVYLDLMRVRAEMAEAMDFSGPEEMEYVYCFERDYTPEDAELFVREVKTDLVPIYLWAKENGIFYSVDYSPLSSDKLDEDLRKIAANIGRECADTYDFLNRYGLYDIEPSAYKADTSFQAYLPSYEAPFIFLNPKGTTEDLTTFVHEFGHATDSYVNLGAGETIDVAEIFSQALEYLSLSHMDGVLSEKEVSQLRKAAMIEALETFINQAAFADFEHKVYALGPDALTVDKLNDLWLQTLQDFGICEEGFEDYYRYYWIDIVHFFEYPFYVISYPVSLDVAIQIYALELEKPGSGLEKYFEILPRDYDSFMDTVTNGGLESPFAEGSMATVAAVIGDALGYKGQLAAAA